MRLVRFESNRAGPRLGLWRDGQVLDLRASYERALHARGVARAEERAAARVPSSTTAFLQGGPESVDALLAEIDGWVPYEAGSVRLLPPIHDPGKIVCIGLNYRDHAIEAGMPIPDEPVLFAKWSNGIIGPGQPIVRPDGCRKLDYEIELGFVIGRPARAVPPERALAHVFGYTVVNDVSARDFQFVSSQWTKGKIPDTFCPVGPCIADRTEIPDPQALALSTRVNGELVQQSTTKQMIFDVAALVSFLSGFMTLLPGDLIATGTPPGVGMGRKPPRFLEDGDVCRLAIEGIGVLENPVASATETQR